MASDGMPAARLAEITAMVNRSGPPHIVDRRRISDNVVLDLLAEMARVTARADTAEADQRILGLILAEFGIADTDINPVAEVKELFSNLDKAHERIATLESAERNLAISEKIAADATSAKLVLESQLDRVWSALGITTVPVGMDVGEEVAKLSAAHGEWRRLACALAEQLKAAEARVAALTEQLRVADEAIKAVTRTGRLE